MRLGRRLATATALGTAGLLLALAALPRAEADEDAGAPVVHGLPLPDLALEGWPREGRSARPKAAEWARAPQVPLTRAGGCVAVRVREWLRLTCRMTEGDELQRVTLLGGARDGVELSELPAAPGGVTSTGGIVLVLPVRPGDRRVLEIVKGLEMGMKAYTVEEDGWLVISELWLPDAPGPTLVVD